eukprot:c9742_g1_i1.p1 GENE.c9742_g1_i1~~c9742_g1_i1.p1  ORF type:complete len:156 (-),score=8.10 c9742_g1_i1:66-533(-)
MPAQPSFGRSTTTPSCPPASQSSLWPLSLLMAFGSPATCCSFFVFLFFFPRFFSFSDCRFCRIDSRLIRSLDRIFATLAAVGTIWHLSTTLANALLALPALIFSCWWLYKSRYIAKHEPWRRSMYVFFHTGWHVVGSLFICLGIFFVLGDLAVRT